MSSVATTSEVSEVSERVRYVLRSSGFELTAASGLRVEPQEHGVLVSWRPSEEMAGITAGSGIGHADTRVRLEISSIAVTRALLVILRQTGYHIVPLDGDLLVTTDPVGESAQGW